MSAAKYDVIVVGAGNAALCAALAAQEQGARVLVLERASYEQRGGNSAFAGGGFRMVYKGLEDILKFVPDLTQEEIENTDFSSYSAEQFFDDLGRVTQYRIDPDLAEVLVHRSTDTVRWIGQKGVRFVPMYGINAFKHKGKFKFFAQPLQAVGGGRGLIDAQFAACEKFGVDVRYGARATSLMYGANGIEGVRITINRLEEEIPARAVVLACGGFEANREWRTRYLGPGWDMAKVRGTRYNTGDGIRMALEIGAQPYGNWSGAHACDWDLNAPEFGDRDMGDGFGKHCYPSGIVINAHGRRFLDEGADVANLTYAKYGRVILQQPGQFCWQIFDGKVLHLLRDTYRVKKMTKVSANTLEELVAKLEGVDGAQALKTIRAYNAAVRQDVAFNPNVKDGRCTVGLDIPKSNWANTVDTPPFEAFGITCGITFTFGGVKITPKAQVLDVEENTIPGLFAAGEMVGGVFYFNYPGGTGLTNGAVFGRTAGESAGRYAVKR